MSQEWEISTPEQLAKAVEGRSDEEINAAMKAAGLESALDRVFEGMVGAFLPDKAKGQSAVIQWDVVTPEGKRTYQMKVHDDKAEYLKGARESARVTLTLSLPDFLRVITGRLNGQTAFFQGKLKLSGDMMFAQTQQSWFRITS